MSHRATYRLFAERRAHGEVRGPRVVRGESADTFVFRRGRHCRVVLTVDRSRVHNPLGAAAVASTGCRPR